MSGNLYADARAPLRGERFDVMLAHRNLVVERIVSSDDIVPTEYVQPQDEWVALLRGQATLKVRDALHHLVAGDSLFLPARTPHTVLRTSPGALWLAVHLHPDTGPTTPSCSASSSPR